MRYLIGFVAVLWTWPLGAAELPARSTVDSVTVFPSGAEVRRIVRLQLSAGDHTVIIDDLPQQAVASSIRVEGKATGKLQIGAVDSRRVVVQRSDAEAQQSARADRERDPTAEGRAGAVRGANRNGRDAEDLHHSIGGAADTAFIATCCRSSPAGRGLGENPIPDRLEHERCKPGDSGCENSHSRHRPPDRRAGEGAGQPGSRGRGAHRGEGASERTVARRGLNRSALPGSKRLLDTAL